MPISIPVLVSCINTGTVPILVLVFALGSMDFFVNSKIHVPVRTPVLVLVFVPGSIDFFVNAKASVIFV